MTADYRVSQALTVRFMGAFLVLVGVAVFAMAALVGLLDLHPDVLSATVILAMVVVVAVGFFVSRVAVLVRLDETGYQVRLLRKAGVKRARWTDLEDVVTGFASGQPVVVLRLRDGRSTTIPVNLLAGDPEDFVRDIAAHAKQARRR